MSDGTVTPKRLVFSKPLLKYSQHNPDETMSGVLVRKYTKDSTGLEEFAVHDFDHVECNTHAGEYVPSFELASVLFYCRIRKRLNFINEPETQGH